MHGSQGRGPAERSHDPADGGGMRQRPGALAAHLGAHHVVGPAGFPFEAADVRGAMTGNLLR